MECIYYLFLSYKLRIKWVSQNFLILHNFCVGIYHQIDCTLSPFIKLHLNNLQENVLLDEGTGEYRTL